jgi:hypothetical protein
MLPPELDSTYRLLKRSFPNGIDEGDLVSLFALLYQEGEMSIRTTTQVAAEWQNRPAVDFLPLVDRAMSVDLASDTTAHRLREILNQSGYQEWLSEE